MSYPKVTEAIQAFLNAKAETHNDPGLIARWSPMMETQVNVVAGKGWVVDGKRNTYTDGSSEWWNIRIPKNANSDPEFKDYSLRWPLDLHVDAIGCTGWDWAARRSRWVGFDFDSITGHAKGVGITPEELIRVKEAAQAIPWVEVRKSTGGNGLHLYVYIDTEFVIENHTVHAAFGRTILGMMSSEADFDFAGQVDVCGGNMWIWARKMSAKNEGLKLLKSAERSLTDDDIPQNWRDNIEVVTRQRTKVRVDGLNAEHEDPFEKLASSRRKVPLDNQHKRIIDALRDTGHTVVWVPDHHMLQTHVCAFDILMKEKKKELGLVGFYKTISEGKDPGGQNCFAFPVDNGGWKVYLYGPGRPEAETWEQDGQGWTTCYFNRAPDLKIAARANGGVEDADKGGFVFDNAKQAVDAAAALGQTIQLPDQELLKNEARLKRHKDGRLVMQIEKGGEKASDMKGDGWSTGKKSTHWSKVFETRVDNKAPEVSYSEYENIIRALVTPSGVDAGWFHKSRDNERWLQHSTEKVNLKLLSRGVSAADLAKITGTAIDNPWTLINLPFQPEYPGGRQWNYDAAQYKYKPAELKDDEVPQHPHWDKVFKHLGRDLDDALQSLEWARAANIKTGRDYLLAWAACLLREPFQPLPYLFFYSPEQNNGKSSFHESLQLLMTKGATPADRALTATNEFNGELANAVLAYIEEKDIRSPGAYNRIKDWVTNPMLAIRKMRTDVYLQPNTLHFVQTANDRDACPVFPGDTRITMIFVSDFEGGKDQEIPREILKQRLRDEAPHFMRTIMDFQLPPVMGRLRLPIISTNTKQRAEELNQSPLQAFIETECHEAPGSLVPFSDFYERFRGWLSPEHERDWVSKQKVVKALPQRFPFGKHTGNIRYIGNLSFEEVALIANARPITLLGDRLIVPK